MNRAGIILLGAMLFFACSDDSAGNVQTENVVRAKVVDESGNTILGAKVSLRPTSYLPKTVFEGEDDGVLTAESDQHGFVEIPIADSNTFFLEAVRDTSLKYWQDSLKLNSSLYADVGTIVLAPPAKITLDWSAPINDTLEWYIGVAGTNVWERIVAKNDTVILPKMAAGNYRMDFIVMSITALGKEKHIVGSTNEFEFEAGIEAKIILKQDKLPGEEAVQDALKHAFYEVCKLRAAEKVCIDKKVDFVECIGSAPKQEKIVQCQEEKIVEAEGL